MRILKAIGFGLVVTILAGLILLGTLAFMLWLMGSRHVPETKVTHVGNCIVEERWVWHEHGFMWFQSTKENYTKKVYCEVK